ncbi:hypothetical protein Ddye_018402 [Dipteronia dyeriana]|uniref:cellulase n=1 Tax=Dipteronia dyeriana TaxID=168575 RepID=A0AAD9X1R0_9ROSI|nr:hypothetical protein Ddye_018402 [Dipteronia dyeriana]
MAFTITMLSWSTIEFRSQLEAKKELFNALDAIKWGTDYFIKAHPQPYVLYSSNLAAKTVVALAAAFVAFRPSDTKYADELVVHAKQLFHGLY